MLIAEHQPPLIGPYNKRSCHNSHADPFIILCYYLLYTREKRLAVTYIDIKIYLNLHLPAGLLSMIFFIFFLLF